MTAVSTAAVAPPPRLRVGAEAVLAAIGLGALAVLLLWWRDTPGISGAGSWLTNAGRITGLLAGYAVVVLLGLMARVPALERGVGTDRLARWHSAGGRYVVCLALAHTLLIIWGYAVAGREGVVRQTADLVLDYPDVLMATVALGLFVAVGVMSARAVRRRVTHETWYLVHLYTYLAVGLAFAHQFATGASFVSDLPARVLWSAMYLLVAAALLWYRVLQPLAGFARRDLRVAAVVPESPGVVSVYVAGRGLDRLAADPGQFFRWRFLARGLWSSANPYSLSAAPTSGQLRITVRAVGDHSAALTGLRPGTRVLAEGPYGGFTAARRRQRRVLLIGGGVGIAPVRALLDSLPGQPGDITVVYRASHADYLPLRDELEVIAAGRGVRLHYVLGPRTDPQARWLTADGLSRLVPGLRRHDVFLCGPDGLVSSVSAELRRAGVPGRHIHAESFAL